MDAFATVEDYESRYGPVEDKGRLSVLLGDATAFILGQGVTVDPDDELQAANLERVCCAVVHRSQVAGDLAGVQQYSESGVGYSASVSPFNPGEDFYLTKPEKQTLGVLTCDFGAILPRIDRGCPHASQDA